MRDDGAEQPLGHDTHGTAAAEAAHDAGGAGTQSGFAGGVAGGVDQPLDAAAAGGSMRLLGVKLVEAGQFAGKFMARIKMSSAFPLAAPRNITVGHFATAAEASRARDLAHVVLHRCQQGGTGLNCPASSYCLEDVIQMARTLATLGCLPLGEQELRAQARVNAEHLGINARNAATGAGAGALHGTSNAAGQSAAAAVDAGSGETALKPLGVWSAPEVDPQHGGGSAFYAVVPAGPMTWHTEPFDSADAAARFYDQVCLGLVGSAAQRLINQPPGSHSTAECQRAVARLQALGMQPAEAVADAREWALAAGCRAEPPLSEMELQQVFQRADGRDTLPLLLAPPDLRLAARAAPGELL
ncbi:hypothetical protein GPECTOR_96g739 [Gonium pectorale]|uniref:Uncharacterized protein n=1 Tax=Gonium pectorale TaxID=33097 RepID=A0A150G068_GONPE|nr:hypothetical protein GPECTOR_96g739 [Gonium pectorale]|eukprot:KXZ43273.1 hypothetical protein GPECTOR_96g739 [Gonium pectorale]